MRKRQCCHLFFFILIAATAQSIGSSVQDSNLGGHTIYIDVFAMTSGPIRLREAVHLFALVLGALMVSAVFWGFRSGWIRTPARVLGGLIAIFDAYAANYIRQFGIGWPSQDFNTGEPTWVFSRSADFCFLIAWFSFTILGLTLVTVLVRKVLPDSVLQSSAQKSSNS